MGGAARILEPLYDLMRTLILLDGMRVVRLCPSLKPQRRPADARPPPSNDLILRSGSWRVPVQQIRGCRLRGIGCQDRHGFFGSPSGLALQLSDELWNAIIVTPAHDRSSARFFAPGKGPRPFAAGKPIPSRGDP